MAKCLALALSAAFCLLLGGAVQAANITLGQTAIFNNNDNNDAGILLAQGPYSLTQTATIQSLSFYVTTAAGQLRLGIYTSGSSNNCKGGTLEAQTAAFTPTANAWNTANVATQVLLPIGNYCLAFAPSSNSLGVRNGTTSGINTIYQSFTFGAMPTTLSTNPSTVGGNYNWSLYATLAPPVPTINGVSLSCGTSCGFVGGSASVQTIGTVSVQEANGTFGGTLSLSDTTHFQLSSSTLQAKSGVVAGSYPLTITATQSGVSGSPFPQAFTIVGSAPPTIYGVTLSGTSFLGGASTGTTIGTVGVQEQNGTFAGTLGLSDTTHFQLSSPSLPSTLKTLTTDAPGTYPLSITATQSNVMGSPFTQVITGGITGTGITGMTLSAQQFVGGSSSGTAVGQISVAELGGTFGGTFALSDTVMSSGDSANFTISGGWLYTSGTVAAGTYHITITATQGGVGGSPFAKAFVITATASTAQQWLFLPSNQTFSPTANGLSMGQAITIEAIGSGSGGAQVTSVSNDGGCGGAYAHQNGASYSLSADDVTNGLVVTVGAAGAPNSGGAATTVLNGDGVTLVMAGGGTAAPNCSPGQVLVGTGFPGGQGAGAPGAGGAGGGGGAGPHGPGGNGSSGASAGGGGGGADGLGNAAAASSSAGGVGGGATCAGGVDNTTPTAGGSGSNGGGGCGGGSTTSGSANGAVGGNSGVTTNSWDGSHGIGGAAGSGGGAATGTDGSAGTSRGYGCGGSGRGDAGNGRPGPSSSSGCPGLVIIGWNGTVPAQSISSVSLTGNSYTVGAAANTVIGTIAVGMTPTSPAFNYPTSTIAVSNTTDFKVVNVGGVPTLEANTTLSAGSYTTTITATQSGTVGSPFTTGTLTITGRTLTITVTPSLTPNISASTPANTTVATLQGVWSNADPFTGSYSFGSPYGCDLNGGSNCTFAISPGSGSSANLIIAPSPGPGVGFDGGTIQNVSVTATQ